jgi:hypothetical protein
MVAEEADLSSDDDVEDIALMAPFGTITTLKELEGFFLRRHVWLALHISGLPWLP